VAVAKWNYALLGRAVIQSSNRSCHRVGLLLEHPEDDLKVQVGLINAHSFST
jgi:hypothetical protein